MLSRNRFDITITDALKSGLIYVGCMICAPRIITSAGAFMSYDTRFISALAVPCVTIIHVEASNFTGSRSSWSIVRSTFSVIQKSSDNIFDSSSGRSRL